MNPVTTGQRITRPIQVLLVEDSASDTAMTLAAFEEGRIPSTMHTVRDGEDAMAFLRGAGEFAGRPRPDLILLDLNLPRKDGREVLAEVKKDEHLRGIPIVVLTSSAAETDVVSCYENYASAYITKPVHFDEFLNAVKNIESFWFSVARLPRTRRHDEVAATSQE